MIIVFGFALTLTVTRFVIRLTPEKSLFACGLYMLGVAVALTLMGL